MPEEIGPMILDTGKRSVKEARTEKRWEGTRLVDSYCGRDNTKEQLAGSTWEDILEAPGEEEGEE